MVHAMLHTENGIERYSAGSAAAPHPERKSKSTESDTANDLRKRVTLYSKLLNTLGRRSIMSPAVMPVIESSSAARSPATP